MWFENNLIFLVKMANCGQLHCISSYSTGRWMTAPLHDHLRKRLNFCLPCFKEEAVNGCVGWLCGIHTVFWDCKESYLNSRAVSLWSMPAVYLAAPHWSGVVHVSILKVTAHFSLLQEVHKERIALETQLEQLRPVTVLWLATSLCSGESRARIPTVLQGEQHGAAEQCFRWWWGGLACQVSLHPVAHICLRRWRRYRKQISDGWVFLSRVILCLLSSLFPA